MDENILQKATLRFGYNKELSTDQEVKRTNLVRVQTPGGGGCVDHAMHQGP